MTKKHQVTDDVLSNCNMLVAQPQKKTPKNCKTEYNDVTLMISFENL